MRELRAVRASLALCALFATLTLLGGEISAAFRLGAITGSPARLAAAALRWAGLCAVYYAPLALFLQWARRDGASPAPSGAWYHRRWAFCALWGALLLCWLPYYLSFFPGSISGDSLVQIKEALGLAPLSDGHPVLGTGLIALFLRGAALLGAPQAGIALYSAFQMLCMSAVFAFAALTLLRAAGAGAWLLYGWFALLPAHPLLGMSMWKDTLHAGSALLVVVQLFLLARAPAETFASFRRMLALAASLFLFATLRHNGLVACVLLLPFFVWRYRAWWKRALAVAGLFCALMGLYKGAAFAALKPVTGGLADGLSLPAQFVARTVVYRWQELPEADQQAVAEILPYAELTGLYNPQIADPVKNRLNMDALYADPGKYLSLFARMVKDSPLLFLESVLCGSYGYWYPETHYIMAAYGLLENPTGAERHSIGIPDRALEGFVEYRLRRLPGLSMLFSSGAAIWLWALALGVLWVRRTRGYGLPLLTLALLWLTLLALPVFGEYRYAYGVVLCAPFCLVAALCAPAGSLDHVGRTQKTP